ARIRAAGSISWSARPRFRIRTGSASHPTTRSSTSSARAAAPATRTRAAIATCTSSTWAPTTRCRTRSSSATSWWTASSAAPTACAPTSAGTSGSRATAIPADAGSATAASPCGIRTASCWAGSACPRCAPTSRSEGRSAIGSSWPRASRSTRCTSRRRAPRLRDSHFGDAVEPRAVVPEDLAAHLVAERQTEELLHRLRKRAVGVRIVGRDHEVVGAHLLDDVDRRLLVHVERDVALALEVLARQHRELVLAAGAELLPLVVEAPQPPVEPAGGAFEKRAAKPRVALQDAARRHAGDGPHQLDRIADGVGDRLEVGVADVAPPGVVHALDVHRGQRRLRVEAASARDLEVRMPRAAPPTQLAAGRGGARRLAVRGNRQPRDLHPHDGVRVALVLRVDGERSLLTPEELRQVRAMRPFEVAGPQIVGLHHVKVAVEDQVAVTRHVTPPFAEDTTESPDPPAGAAIAESRARAPWRS